MLLCHRTRAGGTAPAQRVRHLRQQQRRVQHQQPLRQPHLQRHRRPHRCPFPLSSQDPVLILRRARDPYQATLTSPHLFKTCNRRKRREQRGLTPTRRRTFATLIPSVNHYTKTGIVDPGYNTFFYFVSAAPAGLLARFISLILRWSVRRLMPSFFAAAVTLPFMAASAWAINFFSV